MPKLVTGFSLAPTWLRGTAWRGGGDRIDRVFDPDGLAAEVLAAEQAGLDFAFRPDAAVIDPSRFVRDYSMLGPDPLIQLAALAQHTSRIGLVGTVSASFADPYPVARQLVSLEHLSRGRIGWNVVTSRAGDGNFSARRHENSAARWDRCAEFVAVVEALRRSFPRAAWVADADSGVLLDAARVRPIDHSGSDFSVVGPLPLPVRQSGALPLLQAGGSPAAEGFAGGHADAVFTAAPHRADGVATRARLRAIADAASRKTPLVLPGLSLFLAETRGEAERRYPDALDPGKRTPHWSVVGSPVDAADAIERRVAVGALDGFIAFPGGSWDTAELLFAEVMPLLRARGLVSDESRGIMALRGGSDGGGASDAEGSSVFASLDGGSTISGRAKVNHAKVEG